MRRVAKRKLLLVTAILLLVATGIVPLATLILSHRPQPARAPVVRDLTAPQLTAAFDAASARFGTPAPLLAAICFLEGGMTMHNGAPSIDNGFGCMHLAQNPAVDTLSAAAHDLDVPTTRLRTDMRANIAGGAAILRDLAVARAFTGAEPTSLADWYDAVAAYSHAASDSAATMYADAVYRLLSEGFQTVLSNGDIFTQQAIAVTANPHAGRLLAQTTALPKGCVNDHNVDYPGAIDCVLNPQVYDCNVTTPGTDCTYEDANRPTGLLIDDVVIHDIEGTAQNALTWFQNVKSHVSAHYIVDSNGMVYQVVREKDIAYQAGNWWYNEHSIGIEHAGYDASGYAWYNATEYLASARLTAYLLKKYHIPLEHGRIVSHGTVPSPTLAQSPNHVDPGPYWLWDYYFSLIHAQGVAYVSNATHSHVLTLHPATDQHPWGSSGHEDKYNFNFFTLRQSASTRSPTIPYMGSSYDITNETLNVEPLMSYYYVTSRPDAAGTRDTMYEIWYGVNDHGSQHSFLADAKLAWLAVPPGYASVSQCQAYCWVVRLSGPNGVASVYGRPTSDPQDIIGYAKTGSIFVSATRVAEDPPPPPPPTPTPTLAPTATPTPTDTPTATDTATPTDTPVTGGIGPTIAIVSLTTTATGTIWYEINFNHRQAWVPASEVTFV